MFNFLPQGYFLKELLGTCVATLPHLPEVERVALTKALSEFERFGSAHVSFWGVDDADDAGDHGLTDGEKREALSRFLLTKETCEAEFSALDGHARDVLSERRVHIRVEHDPRYAGADHDKCSAVYIPLDTIELYAERGGDDGVSAAFAELTNIDPRQIVHYSLENHYNQAGELIPAANREGDGKGGNDLANDDLFACVRCDAVADVENSVSTSNGLICDCCHSVEATPIA